MYQEQIENENHIIIYNSKNFKAADIYKINSYNPYGASKNEYRVDVNGFTIDSKISLSKAKSIAKKAIRDKK